MKLHEKAKELGMSSIDLINKLKAFGHEVKSPNQNLNDAQLKDCTSEEKPVQQPSECKGFTFNIIMKNDGVMVSVQRSEFSSKGDLLASETVENKSFPNRHQAFAHIDYTIGKIETGALKP